MSREKIKRKLEQKDFNELTGTLDKVIKQASDLSELLAGDLIQYTNIMVELEKDINKEMPKLIKRLVDFDGYGVYESTREDYMTEYLNKAITAMEIKAKANPLYRLTRFLGFHANPTLQTIMADKEALAKALPGLAKVAINEASYNKRHHCQHTELEKHIDDLLCCKSKLRIHKTKNLARHLMERTIPKFTRCSDADAQDSMNYELMSRDKNATFFDETMINVITDTDGKATEVKRSVISHGILFETQQVNGEVTKELGAILEKIIDATKKSKTARHRLVFNSKPKKTRKTKWVEITSETFNTSKSSLAELVNSIQLWTEFKEEHGIELS